MGRSLGNISSKIAPCGIKLEVINTKLIEVITFTIVLVLVIANLDIVEGDETFNDNKGDFSI
jgi:hypothetical protein